MVKFKSCCFQADKINANGRIYLQEIIEKVYQDIQENDIPLLYELPDDPYDFDNICGKIEKAYIENNELWIEGSTFDSQNDIIVASINDVISNKKMPVYCCATGIGEVDNEGKISNYNLTAVALCVSCSFDTKPLEVIEENDKNS